MNTFDIVYTTAPGDYDYSYVEVLAIAGWTKSRLPKPIRKVSIPTEKSAVQKARYASGLHMVADQTEFDKLVAYDLVKIS